MQVSVEAHAQAPPDVAFGAATDISGWPNFVTGVESIELVTPDPIGVGTRFRETRRMFGRSATEDMTITELVASRLFVLTAFNHGTAYRVEHTFEPRDGGTQLRLTFRGTPVSLPARLFTPLGYLFLGTLRRQLMSDLKDLAREAERRHKLA